MLIKPLRIHGLLKFYKGPINISKCPLKLGNLEWDMGQCPNLLRACHYFGPGISMHHMKLQSQEMYKIFIRCKTVFEALYFQQDNSFVLLFQFEKCEILLYFLD